MKSHTRTAIIRTIWALAFLLIFVAIYIASWVYGEGPFGGGLAFAVIISPLWLIPSVVMGIRAVTAMTAIADQLRRRVQNWSLISIALSLATIAQFVGFIAVFSSPQCVAGGEGCFWTFGLIGWGWLFVFLFVDFITLIIAVVIALISASTSRARRWRARILWGLIGSIIFSVTMLVLLVKLQELAFQNYLDNLNPNAASVLAVIALFLAFAPYCVPIITLTYSLIDRARPKGD